MIQKPIYTIKRIKGQTAQSEQCKVHTKMRPDTQTKIRTTNQLAQTNT